MACPRCRKKSPTGAAFCPKCGASLTASAPPRSPVGIDPNLDSIAKTAARLCDATDALIFLADGATLRLAAHHGSTRTTRQLGEPFPLSRGEVFGRAVLERRVVHVRDLKAAVRTQYPGLEPRQRATGIRTMLAAPLLYDGAAIGVIAIRRAKVRPFRAKQIELLEAFAEHAATAIEKTRLARVLAEALEQQTATSEILRVIASSPTDLQPVMDAVTESAARLCGAYDASIFLRRGDSLEHVAHHGPLAGPIGFLVPLVRGTVTGRSVLEQRTIHVADLQAETEEFPEGSAIAKDLGHRAMVNVPLMREAVAIGALQLCGLEPNPFTDKQIRLLETFANQAVIAIELEARNRDLSVALDRQTATSEVLRVIGSSPTDAEPVFDAIVRSAVRLLGAFSGAVLRLVDDDVHLAAITSTSETGDEAMKGRFPMPLADTLSVPVVRDRAPRFVSDIEVDPGVPAGMREIARARGYRSVLQVPMLREGAPIGVISVTRREPGPFAAEEIALLQTFADQAVIAIENVRLFKELEARNRDLTESLRRETATSEILRVISRSPGDMQPVFDAIVESAVRLCNGLNSAVFLYDGELIHRVALTDPSPEAREESARHWPQRPSPDGGVGRVVLTGAIVHSADVQRDQSLGEGARQNLRVRGIRGLLVAPMLRDGRVTGVISVGRAEPGLFTDSQVQLLQTFADQAVIAIENVRLFTELQARNRDLTEALEQQTATGGILRVISSSPTDEQPVFEAIVESARRLCDASFSGVYLTETGQIRLATLRGVDPAGIALIQQAYPRPIARDTTTGRAVLDRRIVHIEDSRLDPEYTHPLRDALGLRSILTVPILREGLPIGAISVWRGEPRPFTDKQIALLQTFTEQAIIAIENVRLFKELEARNRDLTEALEQQTATGEILRVISTSPTDLEPVFQAIIESAVRLCGAQLGAMYHFDGQMIRFGAHHGFSSTARELIESIFPAPARPDTLVGQTILGKSVVHLPDYRLERDIPEQSRRFAETIGNGSILIVPMILSGSPIGAISVGRTHPGAFPDKQIALLQTFADQAVIAIENVRLFKELEARNRDLTQALEQQTATAEVLRVIGSSPTDAQPVFDAIVRSAWRLLGGFGGAVYRLAGDEIHLAAYISTNPSGDAALRSSFPRPLSVFSPPGEAMRRQAPVVLTDVEADAWIPDDIRTLIRERGDRSGVWVPMMREGTALGAIGVTRSEAGGFEDEQIALLKTFADQAVIAIENVRLFTELEARNHDLTEALEQQTATSEILGVISASPTDVQPVFDTILESATRLCAAENGILFQYDGGAFHTVACRGLSPEAETAFRAQPARPGPLSGLGRMLAEKRAVHIADVTKDVAYPQGDPLRARTVTLLRARTAMWLPLLKSGAVVGAMAIYRHDVRPFMAKQIELVRTFADQAVIAIENVRLFKELEVRNRDLTEALEQQTATAEVLRVISTSPTNLQRVLDTVVTSAARFCGAYDAAMFRLDGEGLRLAAHHGSLSVTADRGVPVVAGTVPGRSVLKRQTVHVADIRAQAEEFPESSAIARDLGFRTMLSVPLLREGAAIGTIGLRRSEVNPFTDKQIKLLQTFADQAVIAIENARLFKELETRTTELTRSVEQLTALGEVSRAVSSTLDVETVLQTVVSRARQLAGADGCAIYEYDEASQHFHLRATDNLAADYVEAIRGVPIRKGEGVSGRAAEMREPFQVTDITEAAAYESSVRDVTIRAGYRAVLSVPLLREDEIIGSLILIRKTPGEFSAEVVEALKTFATQSALAIQNARLFREIEEKGRQLEIASRHKSQFLANMSHELRTPLNAILGYTELLQDGIYGQIPDKAQETMQRVDRSGRHLLALINDVLDLSKIEAGQLTLSLGDYSLKEVAQTVVTALEPLAAEKKLALTVTVAPDLPVGRGDDRRLSQVLLNLVGNAVKFTDAGEVRVEAKASDGTFLVSVSDTGPGIAAEDQARIFEEFQQVDTSNTRKKGGTGLGLAIAKRILALHGGRIWVESAPGKGSTFFFTLPVRVERIPEVV